MTTTSIEKLIQKGRVIEKMREPIIKVYGAYRIKFRRWDGEWTHKRLSTQTHSKELAERILEAIGQLPTKERTKERTDAVAQELFNEEHYR